MKKRDTQEKYVVYAKMCELQKGYADLYETKHLIFALVVYVSWVFKYPQTIMTHGGYVECENCTDYNCKFRNKGIGLEV